jgi:hypothetical protein
MPALGGCATGDAKITLGYGLPAKHVIHAVGPVWQGGTQGEPALLAGCYRKAMALAREHGLRSLAFPLHQHRRLRLSAGTGGGGRRRHRLGGAGDSAQPPRCCSAASRSQRSRSTNACCERRH